MASTTPIPGEVRVSPPLHPAVAIGPSATGRIMVRDDNGRPLVARVYGEGIDPPVVVLPDGRLGWPDGRSDTDEPFRVATPDEVARSLTSGPFRGFQVRRTDHYVVLYQCSEEFAEDSARLLETLYQGLSKTLAQNGLTAREAEFPLVAVIFAHEGAFRAFRPVAADIQAYYEIISNRIYFYEMSERDRESPEVAAIRKPQTIAHEGTHQVLQNIGLQPRLADWPIWLVEGLAEYCAPTTTKPGAEWAGCGKVNSLHMATLRDLDDRAAHPARVRGVAATHVARDPRSPMVEDLVSKTTLGPTDYALAWALTHYLATHRCQDFLAYLKAMSAMSPRERKSPADHLDRFRDAFGPDLAKLDRQVYKHLSCLKYESLPYYAVLFEQPIGGERVKRAAIVSQSPSMIRQWLDAIREPHGYPPTWQAVAYPTRTRASLHADRWIAGP